MKNYFSVFLLLIGLLSCQKEELMLDLNLCLSEIESIPFEPSGCPSYNDQDACEIVDLGLSVLSDESKDAFPDFCLKLDDELTFFDSIGNTLKLQVKEKIYKHSRLTLEEKECPNNQEMHKTYCLQTEYAYMQLGSEVVNLRISARSTVCLDSLDIFGSSILITSTESELNNFAIKSWGGIYSHEFWDSGYECYNTSIKFDSIDLLNQTFYDVTSYYEERQNADKEIIYYSFTDGLIAFKDVNRTTWVRN